MTGESCQESQFCGSVIGLFLLDPIIKLNYCTILKNRNTFRSIKKACDRIFLINLKVFPF